MNGFSRALFFSFYRAFGWPVLITAFRVLGKVNRKISEGLVMRMPADASHSAPWLEGAAGTQPIWIHCASGEFEYAKPVITRLKRTQPSVQVLVTYFSPSIRGAVQKFPGVDRAVPLPWDRPHDLQKFIAHHRPRALLIARTDTWPEMLRQAREAQIPTLLFSATLAKSSGRARGLGRWASRAVFSYLDRIYCVSAEDKEIFNSLGFRDVTEVAGDTRYDQVQERLANPKPVRDELFRNIDPAEVFVAGSTWDEDEDVLIEVAAKLSSELRFAFVPHEPSEEHIECLMRKLKAHGLESTRYSTALSWAPKSVLIVDKIGILAELYLKGRFAFVGGSYRKTVHSVMEPLAAGCLTFVGPLHQNNREALEFRQIAIAPGSNLQVNSGLHMVQPAKGAKELVELLHEAMKHNGPDLRERIRAEITLRSGKSDRVVDWVQSQLASRERLKNQSMLR